MADILADYAQIDLDSRALDHVRKRLEQGRTLGELLLNRPDLPQGRISTYLPAGTAQEELYDFEEGLLPEPPEETHRLNVNVRGIRGRLVPVPNMDEALGGLVTDYLAADAGRLCIFSHPLADSSDGWIVSSPLRLATFQKDVYVLITSADVTKPDDLAKMIRKATSLWWSAALTDTMPGAEVANDRVELAEESLRELAAHAEHILVEAYDQEGFLDWSKP